MSQWGIAPGKPWESILNSTARINIWHGPVRSAKTVHSCIRWLEYILTAPPGELAMIGKTEATLQRNMLSILESATDGEFSYSMGRHSFSFGGREGYLFGANDERAESKLRGLTLAGALGDELSLWHPNFFRQLMMRLSVPGSKMFGTTNPDGPYHWLKTDYIDRAGEIDLKAFTWPIRDNIFLDRGYIENIEKEYTGLWYKRFVLGMWVAAEGAVYDFWQDDAYTYSGDIFAKEWYLSADYGTSNPTAVGLFGVNAQNIWLDDEYYYDARATGRQMTDAETVTRITEWLGPRRGLINGFIVDPSAASFQAELRQKGFRVIPANNSVIDGIRCQATALQNGTYRVNERCKQTIRDYTAYSWDTSAQSRGEDRPLKTNDHTKDMERYALYTLATMWKAPTLEQQRAARS